MVCWSRTGCADATPWLLVVKYPRSHMPVDVGGHSTLLMYVDSGLSDRLHGGHCLCGDFKGIGNVGHHACYGKAILFSMDVGSKIMSR